MLTGRESCGLEDRPAHQWPRCGEGKRRRGGFLPRGIELAVVEQAAPMSEADDAAGYGLRDPLDMSTCMWGFEIGK